MKMMKVILTAFCLSFALQSMALEVGDYAPCTTLDFTQNGENSVHCIREPDVAEQPVVVEFFSIYCSDCIKNLPQYQNLADQLKGVATVRLVSIDLDRNAVREFIQKYNIQLEVGFDSDRMATKAYKIVSTPTLFVLNYENIIQAKHTGILKEEEIRSLVELVKSL